MTYSAIYPWGTWFVVSTKIWEHWEGKWRYIRLLWLTSGTGESVHCGHNRRKWHVQIGFSVTIQKSSECSALLAILNDYLLRLCPVWAEALRKKEKWDFFSFLWDFGGGGVYAFNLYLLSVWEAAWLSHCGQGKWNFISWLKIFWNSKTIVLNLPTFCFEKLQT